MVSFLKHFTLFLKTWHHYQTMQKIEKWRLQQLSHTLEKIAGLLTKGGNSEWGNVFTHFHLEAEQVVSADKLNFEGLVRFIANIKNCFSGLGSFKNLVLSHQNSDTRNQLNHEFFDTRALLYEILEEIEARTKEYKH
jgi:hypothetical protein